MAKRCFWAWGHEAVEPTAEQMKTAADELSKRYRVNLDPVSPHRPSDISLRTPRISPPTS